MRVALLAALAFGCSSRPLYLPEADQHDLAVHDLAMPPPPLDLAVAPRDFAVAPIPPDLAVPTRDLSSVDLTSPPDLARADLGGFCAGTAVAGTCLQTFFAPAAACYDPAGACVVGPQIIMYHSYCFADGAKATESEALGLDDWIFRSSTGQVCYTWRRAENPNYFTVGANFIFFDPASGSYSCDEFSRPTGSIGPNCGGCSALCALFQLPTGCTASDDNCR